MPSSDPGGRIGPSALPDDRLLHDRPQVRRDPVDEQAGREVDDEEDEEERQRQEDHPLRAVRRRRHQQRRQQLRADVEDDQDDQHAAGRLVRQVRDEEEARRRRPVAARHRVRRARRVDRPGRCRSAGPCAACRTARGRPAAAPGAGGTRRTG